MFLHDYLLVCKISTVRTLALKDTLITILRSPGLSSFKIKASLQQERWKLKNMVYNAMVMKTYFYKFELP